MFKNALITLLVLFSLSLQAFTAQAAVILLYHHVSDGTPAITSVTPAQFKEQMQYLADNDFIVVPLSQVVDAIRNLRPIAEKTVVITFDDGYKSVAETASPILKEYGFPYTLFVSIEPIKAKYRGMMSWEELIKLSKEGAEIANHSWGHEHLIRKLAGETEPQWILRTEKNILDSEAEIRKATGQDHKMFAYPYGEYNQALEDIISRNGFVGLGQQSGAAGRYSSLTALPRFPVAGVYADLASLKVKMHSLNMPVLSLTPKDSELKDGNWRPELTLTLDISDIYPHQMMCFIQGQGAKKPLWLSENEFSIRAEFDLPPGRSRYNCTVPSKTKSGYYWFSQAWVRPNDDGSWSKE
ncbi:polysaccharide deacetylase family protein [Shewanella violacea]|uniref:Polysaccharide deacetylase family protein n=1 Tax=Shewanella violacea (strain JCM 10179 / CIP 106290 / LMG 19151 / DSS12) TaxID=637905 RepID=D4ZDM2_SHEVD|nr:polysaccharide deacetylase family protein [Shewanella violacea]BAJ00144.1 polysaccharide deacetylase family protein [Shewanella violacea DSS12]